MTRIRLSAAFVLVLSTILVPFAAAQQAAEGVPEYREPPAELAALVGAPPVPAVSLSPARDWMLVLGRPALPRIAEVAEPELRLAGVRINPRTNGPSRASSFNSIALRRVSAAGEPREVSGLPAEARIRNVAWSPGGSHAAFTVDTESEVALYVLDVGAAQARRLSSLSLNDAAPGAPFRWTAEGGIVARVVPASRGAAPEPPRTPAGPVVEETTGEAAPARTYQDLLQNAHDIALFEHYFTSELVHLDIAGGERPLNVRGIVTDFDPAPDGRHLLVERTHRPFSYLVPIYRFPSRTTVHDLSDGRELVEVADLPLAENVPVGFGSVRTGRRSIDWRADEPATLYWVEALDEGDIRREADFRDRLFQWSAPFAAEPVALATLPLRYSQILWGDDDLALVQEFLWQTRTRRVYVLDPSRPAAEPRVLFDVSTEDRYNDPGAPVTLPNGRGYEVLATADGGGSIFLIGQGASPEGNRPFLRKMDVASAATEELFRSEAPYYERPVDVVSLADRTIITRRESVSEPPNYYLRDLDEGGATALTDFPHPYPHLADVQKEVIEYEREDGVPLRATLYLPPGYDAERNGPLPAFVWAYPTEYKSADAAGQRRDSPYQFTTVSYWGAVPWVTRGYAILDDAAMPIIGEGDREPNDSFVDQLVASARAAIDEGVRRGVVDPERVGVGGHSYGAFMTANLLAHSDLFRAGIARSGAYNRTLTPFGFQAEERTYWEAPEIYYSMSPFMHAEKVDEPLLMIHGLADNNSGTFPMQSERFYNAVKGLGGTARLVMLPHESHGYRARESILHMLWEMDRWLETYVKN